MTGTTNPREITAHKGAGGLDDQLTITCHGSRDYQIQLKLAAHPDHAVWIKFQNGLVKEHGINGITNESLIAVVMDRLEQFQQGEFACMENNSAVSNLAGAMYWLQCRTRDRVNRGVEGTDQP